MNETIKKGDWVEVVKTYSGDEKKGIKVGDKYEVVGFRGGRGKDLTLVSVDGIDVIVGGIWVAYDHQLKKVGTKEGKTKERVASNHYHKDNNGNDVWQFIDDNLSKERVKGFHQGNALKYITRYNSKHSTSSGRIEDLEKAKVYIDKLIELESELDE